MAATRTRRITHIEIESTPLAATMESRKTQGPQQGAALMKRTTKYMAPHTSANSDRRSTLRDQATATLSTDRQLCVESGLRAALNDVVVAVVS
jgi:hypothetical protein